MKMTELSGASRSAVRSEYEVWGLPPAEPAATFGQCHFISIAEPEFIHQEFCEAACANVLARDSRFEANSIEYPLQGADLLRCEFKA